jgi:hypothetical protein
MYEHVQEPVLIIKTAWGGKSLSIDFRPPSAGVHKPHEDKLKALTSPGEIAKAESEYAEAAGHYYRLMKAHVLKVTGEIQRVYPGYDPAEGFELAGFVWFQGCNDFGDVSTYPEAGRPGGYDEYSRLMACFIRDVRKDFNAPNMPFVIGVLGIGGDIRNKTEDKETPMILSFRDAMAAPADLPEFRGNVVAVRTEEFWDPQLGELQARWSRVKEKDGELKGRGLDSAERKILMDEFLKTVYSPEEWEMMESGVSNASYHYLGSVKIMSRIGKGFADGIIGLDGAP